jgi:hypothetical protein
MSLFTTVVISREKAHAYFMFAVIHLWAVVWTLLKTRAPLVGKNKSVLTSDLWDIVFAH